MGLTGFEAALRTVAAAGEAGRDFLAVLVAVMGGAAVLFYAASSDLFRLKLFKFDPFALKLPRQTRIEYWYTRAARRWESFLADGGWRYAKAKKSAKVKTKTGWRSLRREARRLLPEAVRRLNRDIALGVLAITIVLVALLLARLL
jgi:hypothetical protein